MPGAMVNVRKVRMLVRQHHLVAVWVREAADIVHARRQHDSVPVHGGVSWELVFHEDTNPVAFDRFGPMLSF